MAMQRDAILIDSVIATLEMEVETRHSILRSRRQIAICEHNASRRGHTALTTVSSAVVVRHVDRESIAS
jgi:hypothetical protein